MYYPTATIRNRAYADALHVHAFGQGINLWRVPQSPRAAALLLSDVEVTVGSIPDHFVLGPFVGLGCDVDCDGTSHHAKAIDAPNLAAAKLAASDDIYEVITLREAIERDIWAAADDPTWERRYFADEGYCSLGNSWNPWVADDSLGTIYDHSHEDSDLADYSTI